MKNLYWIHSSKKIYEIPRDLPINSKTSLPIKKSNVHNKLKFHKNKTLIKHKLISHLYFRKNTSMNFNTIIIQLTQKMNIHLYKYETIKKQNKHGNYPLRLQSKPITIPEILFKKHWQPALMNKQTTTTL